jgi:hypothetical protein
VGLSHEFAGLRRTRRLVLTALDDVSASLSMEIKSDWFWPTGSLPFHLFLFLSFLLTRVEATSVSRCWSGFLLAAKSLQWI